MTLLWLPAGILLPTLTGWLLLRLIEGRTPVLFRAERIALGFVLGLTFTMFVTFVAHITGLILFTRLGFLAIQLVITALLALTFFIRIRRRPSPSHPNLNLNLSLPLRPTPLWAKILLGFALLWIIAKIAGGGFLLVSMPPYFDDTLKNWNMRGKVFFLTQRLDLPTPSKPMDPLSSYPPTVSMAKTELTAFAGQWNEGLVNSIHLLWFLAAFVLLFEAVRRHSRGSWGLVGTYLLAGLPLYFMHGVNAYADVFLSAHLFAAVSLLFHASREEGPRRSAFLRLSALATGLLVFTKNEALLLYLPIVLVLLALALFLGWTGGRMSKREIRNALIWYGGWLLSIALPWLLFKWTYGLSFGNAKAVSTGYAFGWQPDVLRTLWINTFFEGNWLLLFPLFFLLVAVRWRHILTSPLFFPILFVFAALLLQIVLFLFTSLSVEATMQTGLGRGIIHLAPLIVLATTLLLHDAMKRE